MKAVSSLGDGATGVFGVELFLVNTPGGGVDVLLNEVAPRPHNTGHYTQDACAVSQFENHLRAVCGLPLGDTDLIVGAAASEYIMLQILYIVCSRTFEKNCCRIFDVSTHQFFSIELKW